jgi:hypothetical protein
MATFQTEYDKSTTAIDSIVNTQLSSVLNWLNVPGSLVKASSSAAGFVWGYNAGNTIYTCQLPCTGDWKEVDFSSNQVSNVLDLTTDDTNLYILYTNTAGALSLLTTAATNQGTRTTIPVPFAATSIFSTHTYIWAQDASLNKQKCPKPCSMPNWQSASDKTITITSSDNMTLYGVDASGQAMQTDETLQSPWQPIGEVVGSIYGRGSDGTLYGLDSVNNAFKYDGKVSPLYTVGLNPTNLEVDKTSNQLWITTETPGDSGNIFVRSQKPDYTNIMSNISPLDQKRSNVVDRVKVKYNMQTDNMIVNNQVDTIVNYFKKLFHIDGQTATKAKTQGHNLNERIREAQAQLDYVSSLHPMLLGILLTLVVVILVYILGSYVLGGYVHLVSILVVAVGVVATAKFSVTNK